MDKRIDLSIYLPVVLPIFLFFLFLSHAFILAFGALPMSILSLIVDKIDDKPGFERFKPKKSTAESILFFLKDFSILGRKDMENLSIDSGYVYNNILISNKIGIKEIVIDAIRTSDHFYDKKKTIILEIQEILSFVEGNIEYISFISFRTFCSFVKNILLSIIIFSITGGIIISPFIIMNKLNFYLIKPEYYSSFSPAIRNCEPFFFLFWGGIFSWFVTWLYFQAEFYIVTKKDNKKAISYLKEQIDEIDARISEQQDKIKTPASA